MDEIFFIICIAGTLCRLPRVGAVRIQLRALLFGTTLACLLAAPAPRPPFFFLPLKLDGCFLSSVFLLVVVIFMHTPNRFFLVENPAFF